MKITQFDRVCFICIIVSLYRFYSNFRATTQVHFVHEFSVCSRYYLYQYLIWIHGKTGIAFNGTRPSFINLCFTRNKDPTVISEIPIISEAVAALVLPCTMGRHATDRRWNLDRARDLYAADESSLCSIVVCIQHLPTALGFSGCNGILSRFRRLRRRVPPGDGPSPSRDEKKTKSVATSGVDCVDAAHRQRRKQ